MKPFRPRQNILARIWAKEGLKKRLETLQMNLRPFEWILADFGALKSFKESNRKESSKNEPRLNDESTRHLIGIQFQ